MRYENKILLTVASCLAVLCSAVTQTQDAFAADTLRPSVSFITPAGGSVLAGNVSVKVSATDNVKVASVKLYVDYTSLVGTDNYAPYEFNLDTRD